MNAIWNAIWFACRHERCHCPRRRQESRRFGDDRFARDEWRNRGLAVPTDISLVCFDDVEHLAVHRSRALSHRDRSADRDVRSARGAAGAERIGAERGGPPRAVILQAELLVRQSCGAKLSGGGRRRTISP
jgi:hypothetical protein